MTFENLGKAPVSWLVLTIAIKDNNSTISNYSFVGNIDLLCRQPQIACKFFKVAATDILPTSWVAILIDIDSGDGLEVEFTSSCANEPGAIVTVSQTQFNSE